MKHFTDMKFNLSFPVILLTVLMVSCNRKEEVNEPCGSGNDLALEVFSDYRVKIYDRPLSENKDADFMSPEVERAMQNSRIYRNRMSAATRSTDIEEDEVPEEWECSEEIPFCADICERIYVYSNGDSEYSRTTDLDPEVNPLLCFHETELDLTHCVARVEVKDGLASTYNNRGELLSQTSVEMPDYSEYLDLLEECEEESEEESEEGTRSGIVSRDINWLRSRMESECATRGVSDSSYSVYEKGDRVVLEQYVNATRGGSALTVRTFFSKDISRNYGFEQLAGGVLQVRCTHFFDASESAATRSNSVSFDGMLMESPTRTVLEELSYLQDGTPMVSVSDKEFRQNTIRYNSKH